MLKKLNVAVCWQVALLLGYDQSFELILFQADIQIFSYRLLSSATGTFYNLTHKKITNKIKQFQMHRYALHKCHAAYLRQQKWRSPVVPTTVRDGVAGSNLLSHFIPNFLFDKFSFKLFLKICFLPLHLQSCFFRVMAQPGSAHVWGAWGRKFESCSPDRYPKGAIGIKKFQLFPFLLA